MKGDVRFDHVTKVYRWRGTGRRGDSFKGALLARHRRVRRSESHVALDDVSFDLGPGEALALIGPNGSGKSTLLKLAGGILRPTEGTVVTEGRVTALIELGAGFHPEITGRENVLINGMLLGLSRAEIERRMDEIVEFAGVGRFIDHPVKTYSSGMYVRLGFAVAVAVEPDVLLIDEVLAVGDAEFTRRCLDRLARLRRAGVSMVVASHDLELVANISERALYLDHGRVVTAGATDSVVARYRSDVAGSGDAAGGPRRAVRVIEDGRRWGTGEVEITAVEIASGGRPVRMLPSGTDCLISVHYRAHLPVTDFVFGIAWHRTDGTQVGGHNSDIDGLRPRRLAGEGVVRCGYPRVELSAGEYLVDVAVHAADGLAYDYWCDAARVVVTTPRDWPGVWAPQHGWEHDGTIWE